jgi:hypothetical protein
MNKPSRRDILKAGGVGSAGLATAWLLQACDLSTDPAGEGNGGDNDTGKSLEAPMLTQRVEDGELPPVEERLPTDPMVLEPLDSIGVYGGQWRTAVSGTSDVPWLSQTIGYEHLVRWDLEWEDGDTSDPIPNLASISSSSGVVMNVVPAQAAGVEHLCSKSLRKVGPGNRRARPRWRDGKRLPSPFTLGLNRSG